MANFGEFVVQNDHAKQFLGIDGQTRILDESLIFQTPEGQQIDKFFNVKGLLEEDEGDQNLEDGAMDMGPGSPPAPPM